MSFSFSNSLRIRRSRACGRRTRAPPDRRSCTDSSSHLSSEKDHRNGFFLLFLGGGGEGGAGGRQSEVRVAWTRLAWSPASGALVPGRVIAISRSNETRLEGILSGADQMRLKKSPALAWHNVSAGMKVHKNMCISDEKHELAHA